MTSAVIPSDQAGVGAAVTLRYGRQLIVHNPVPHRRTPVAGVPRDGRAWKKVLVQEDQPGEFSCPAVIQTLDGRVRITYTWRRERVKHVVEGPARLAE